MNQIILNNSIVLPEVSRDHYACWEEELNVQVKMINGRMVIEQVGKVWKVSYQYDYMGNELMRRVLTILRSGAPFSAAVLPDMQDEMVASTFITESLSKPVFAFSRNGTPYWHNLSFSMREAEPHD